MKLRLFFIAQILRVKNFQLDKNLLIFSDPRGGSTWLMELLMNIPKTAVIWEPFQLNQGVIPKYFNLGWRPYIPENTTNEEVLELFNTLLSGKIHNAWTSKFSSINDYVFANNLIFKFVRLNSMLPWLSKNFKFNHKPIYLLRHPIAVALSQIKAFHQESKFEGYVIPNVQNNEKYLDHKEFLLTLSSLFEKLIADWCLHNMETIKHERGGEDWIIVYYEKLLLEPEKELERIFNELNITKPNGLYENINKASFVDFQKDFKFDKNQQLRKWEQIVTKNQLEKAQRILNYFKIENYSCYNNLPLFQGLS